MTPVTTMAQSTLVLRDSKPIDDRVTVSVAQTQAVTVTDARSYALAGEHLQGLAQTQAVTVTDARSYALAGEHLQGLAALEKEIEAYFRDDKSRAYQLWQSQCKKEKAALTLVQAAGQRLRGERQTWKAEQDRLLREAEQRESRQAQQDEQARLLAEAALLEAQHQPELAAAIVEEAISAPAPVVVLPSNVPKDLPKRTLYKWRVVNAAMVPRDYMVLDDRKLTAYTNAMKGAARVPGIQFYTEEIDVVRTT